MRRFTRISVSRAKRGYKIRCMSCNHIWFPKLKTPYKCPQCGTRL